jgi:ribonuclease HI
MTEQGRPALLIYTDASHGKGSGSWGAVITGPEIKTMEAGGEFKGHCPCSTTAEMQGVANALHIAVAAGHLRRGTAAVVLCDNQSVVQLISGKCLNVSRMKRRAPALFAALRHVREAMQDIQAQITFQWVRGHQSAAEADEHRPFNRRADQLAKLNNSALQDRRAQRFARRAQRRRDAKEAQCGGAVL